VATTIWRQGSERFERWEAQRVLRWLMVQESRPRLSYGPAAWYPDPLRQFPQHRFAKRWWDDARWTRFVWWGDSLHVMDLAPRWFRRERDPDAAATGMLAVRMAHVRIPPLPPHTLRSPQLLPRRRRVALLVCDLSCIIGLLVLLVALIRIWFTT
jgi:hypothetical protein